MIELTSDNAREYLIARGERDCLGAQIEALTWGVSNAVLRVTTPARTFILKQSRPRLRTQAAWFSDIARVYREQEIMEELEPHLPSGTVPKVLFADRPNYVFAMSHAPLEATVWKQELLAGSVDFQVGEHAGRILGQIHQCTAGAMELRRRFEDSAVFVQLRVDPFYRRILERHPDLAPPIRELIERMLTAKDAICHGDYSPKNMLIHNRGFMLVDYETAYYGDPTMDLGFFLSHLLLKSVNRPSQRPDYFKLSRRFWQGYARHAVFKPLAELQTLGIQHLACCALARIDGTSPADYLHEEGQREEVRRACRSLLSDRPTTWDEVLHIWESNMNPLRC